MNCYRMEFCRKLKYCDGEVRFGWAQNEELHVIAGGAGEAIDMVERIYLGTRDEEGQCVGLEVFEVECVVDVVAWPGRELDDCRVDVLIDPHVLDLNRVREAGL